MLPKAPISSWRSLLRIFSRCFCSGAVCGPSWRYHSKSYQLFHPKFSTSICQYCIFLLYSQSSYHKALSLPSPCSSDPTMPLDTHSSKLTAEILKIRGRLHTGQRTNAQRTFPTGCPEAQAYSPLSTHLGYVSCPLWHCTWNKVVPDSAPKWFCLQ